MNAAQLPGTVAESPGRGSKLALRFMRGTSLSPWATLVAGIAIGAVLSVSLISLGVGANDIANLAGPGAPGPADAGVVQVSVPAATINGAMVNGIQSISYPTDTSQTGTVAVITNSGPNTSWSNWTQSFLARNPVPATVVVSYHTSTGNLNFTFS